jgi:hypothetical protein
MFDEPALKAALAEIGYRRLKRHVYRADWSTEVEHFLFFQLYGAPKDYLAADFGFRNRAAQSFALRSIQTYGPELYRMIGHEEPYDCFMRFSLGGLVGTWGMRSSLTISSMPGPALADKIKRDIEQCLFPFIRQMTSSDRLVSRLLVDAEPCAWYRSNGAMRAAMIVHLSQRLGKHSDEIRLSLQPHLKEISHHLLDGPDPDPRSYVDKIIRDAFAQALPSSA